ncbi:MAG: hypothetical protein CMJ78_22000 [Planctomycetaceae bacterium]|nr:hypothetical protein [Planctomycetaceae bacterium]
MPDTTLKGDGRDLLRIVLPAAARGDLKSVRKFVKKYPWWVFRIGPHGRTMLWEATYKKRVDTVRYLIDNGADVNQLGTYYTPLRVDLSPYALARKVGHSELMEILAVAGALFDAHSAAYFGDLDVLEEFLKKSPELANSQADIYSGDPVQVADVSFNKKLSGALDRVEASIEEIFDRDSQFVHEQLKDKRVGNSQKNMYVLGYDVQFHERHSAFGELILDLLDGRHICRSKPAAIRELHRRWAGHRTRWSRQFDYYKPPYIDVILHYAVQGGHLDAVKMLFDHGAEIPRHGKSVLQQCLDSRPMMDLLIKHGAKVRDVARSDWIGDESLEKMAAEHSATLDINARADGQYPPLVEACRGNHNAPDHPSRVKAILKRGAEINITDYKGKTALHRAAQANFGKIGKLLCDSGADLEARDNEGETPIFDAVRHGRLVTTKLLIEQGARVDVENNKSRTILLIAQRSRKPDAEKIERLIQWALKKQSSR